MRSSTYQRPTGLPRTAVSTTEQPLALPDTDIVVSTPLPMLPHPRNSRESIVLEERSADMTHAGAAETLQINNAERDLEAGPSIPSPVEADAGDAAA